MGEKEINVSRKRYISFWLIVLIAVVLALIISSAIWLCSIIDNDKWRFCADYERYADDFNFVKEYITAEFADKSDDSVLITVGYNAEQIRLYDTEAQKYLSIPDDILLSISSIAKNGFPSGATWAYIITCGGNVLFGVDARGCALVYSPEENTAWVDLFYPNASVKIKEIEDGWYHVVKDN